MAKFETALRGDFDEALNYFHNGILQGSMSASYEDESYVQFAGVRCCVRVYERYSMAGGNRLSMTLTLVGDGEDLFLSAKCRWTYYGSRRQEFLHFCSCPS